MTSTTTRLFAALALSLAAAAPVMAQEATPDTWISAAQSTKTRAQVVAELATARANGTIKSWSAGYMDKTPSTAQREAVRTVARQALASGEIAAINAEAQGLGHLKARAATGMVADTN